MSVRGTGASPTWIAAPAGLGCLHLQTGNRPAAAADLRSRVFAVWQVRRAPRHPPCPCARGAGNPFHRLAALGCLDGAALLLFSPACWVAAGFGRRARGRRRPCGREVGDPGRGVGRAWRQGAPPSCASRSALVGRWVGEGRQVDPPGALGSPSADLGARSPQLVCGPPRCARVLSPAPRPLCCVPRLLPLGPHPQGLTASVRRWKNPTSPPPSALGETEAYRWGPSSWRGSEVTRAPF